MGKEKNDWVQESQELLIATMKSEAERTEQDFAQQPWQSNPSFQKVSEIKEVEDGNQSVQPIQSNGHLDETHQ